MTMALTWAPDPMIQSATMLLKSGLLLLFIVSFGDAHSLSPFDLIDNYVEQFRAHVDQLTELAETYHFKEEDYDILQHKDSKLLLSKYISFNIILILRKFRPK